MAAPLLQTQGPGNADQLLTTTMFNARPGIRDNIFKSNPLFKWLFGKKKIMVRGGAAYSHGILFEANNTVGSYQSFDILDTTPQNGMTRDQWDWTQKAVSISIDGFLERVANRGESELIDILETKRFQAEESLALDIEKDVFKASPDAKSIRSLPTIILDSGTEGDINGGTNTWWQSTVTASGSFAAQGRKDMTNLYNTLSIENPATPPDMIISTQSIFQSYESLLVPQERITDTKSADIGIQNLKFKATPWTWSPQATAQVIYMLHSSALEFVVNSDTNFLVTPFITPSNQDARVSHILLAFLLATGNRRKLGKLTGVTA